MGWLSKTRNKVILLAPTLAVYIVYLIVPVFIAIYYSFMRYSGISKPRFYGWNNYIRLFNDPSFGIALKNTCIILVMSLILLGVGSFFVALLLNQRLRFSNVSKALLFSPAIIASIIVDVYKRQHHAIVAREQDLDGELLALIDEAYHFAMVK